MFKNDAFVVKVGWRWSGGGYVGHMTSQIALALFYNPTVSCH